MVTLNLHLTSTLNIMSNILIKKKTGISRMNELMWFIYVQYFWKEAYFKHNDRLKIKA